MGLRNRMRGFLLLFFITPYCEMNPLDRSLLALRSAFQAISVSIKSPCWQRDSWPLYTCTLSLSLSLYAAIVLISISHRYLLVSL